MASPKPAELLSGPPKSRYEVEEGHFKMLGPRWLVPPGRMYLCLNFAHKPRTGGGVFFKLMRPVVSYSCRALWWEERQGRLLLEKHWNRPSCGARLPSAPTRTGDVKLKAPVSLRPNHSPKTTSPSGKFVMQHTRVHNDLNFEAAHNLFNGLR